MRRLTRWLCALLGLILVSQLPEFTQQYRQRIGGAVDALGVEIARFDADSAAEGLSRDAALLRYETSSDEFLVRRGESTIELIERHGLLLTASDQLHEAPAIARPLVLVTHLDIDLASQTLSVYRPAVPVLEEGLVYGGLGAALGWIAGLGLASAFKKSKKSRTIEA